MTKITFLFPVNTDILEYIVNIEVNVSQAILFEQIKSSLESISSFQIDNTTEIESVNITTGKLCSKKQQPPHIIIIFKCRFLIINVSKSKLLYLLDTMEIASDVMEGS